MTDLPARMLRNLRADVELVGEREIEPPPVPEASRVWASEQATTGPRGEGVALYLAAQVGRGLIVLCASGGTGSWEWPGLGGLASAQARRVQGAIGGGQA